jgi:capsular polysaccharide biosynthesis protein
VVFPLSLQSFVPILRTACPEVRLLLYDDRRETLHLSRALLPGMLVSSTSHLHDLFTATVKRLNLRYAGGAARRAIFLSREGVQSFRTLRNEAELAQVARGFGFEVVRPQTLAWADQVRMFASASHVIGEFSSALHGAMFSPAETKVVCLNWLGPVQSAIAASLGHRIGYVMPSGGAEIRFRPGWTETQYFEIDPELFRERLAQIV